MSTAAPPPAPSPLTQTASVSPALLPNDDARSTRAVRLGVFAGLGAHLVWGMFPLYFKQIEHVPALNVLSHRVLWSAMIMAAVVWATGQRRELLGIVRSPKTLLALTATGLLIATNWLLFVWSVVTDRMVQGALGYFLTPMVIVTLGLTVMRDTLRPAQVLAITLAFAGVGVQTVAGLLGGGEVPWIAAGIGLTFGLYSLIRKLVNVGALSGLAVETGVVAPLAAAQLAFAATYAPFAPAGSGYTPSQTLLLLLSLGVMTSLPLVLFGVATRRLRLSTIGFLQYTGPTTQLLLAVLLYGEPFTGWRVVGFGFVWAGLAVYSTDALLRERARARLMTS